MIALLLALLAQDPHDPETELKAFQPIEDVEINLYASEKLGIANPVQCRWDEKGRLWVICTWAYPQIKPGEKPDDKVIVLEDLDGDGRADKSTVFASGLFMPMGLELGDGGVWVGTSTDLLHFRDLDGDLKADEKRVVLTGFGTGDSHQNINSFRRSPGGELWFCQGLHAYSRVETPWGVEKLDSAGVWRFRPKTQRLDGFLHGAMGAHNPWGLDFDDWGQPIMVAGNGHGIYHMVPGMMRAEHFQVFPHQWRQGRKFAGMDFVGSTHWPESEQGTFVSGGFMNNAVYRFAPADDRSSFSIKELPPLVRSTHVSFRPVDVKIGSDGALYVADWYNPIIGHYQASFRHPDRDTTHGRIWRVSWKGRPLVKPPVFGKTASELVELLRSPERWVRDQAKRLLAERDPKEVATAVAGFKSDDERLKLEALGVLESVEVVDPAALAVLLGARDFRARAYAARVVGRWADRLADPLALLERAVQDEHPRVRLEAVVSASYVASPRAVEVVAMAADRAMDPVLGYAFAQSVRTLAPRWHEEFKAGRVTFGGNGARLQMVLAAAGSADLLKPLVAQAKAGTASPDALKALAAVGGPAELALVLETSSDAGVLQEVLARRLKPEGEPAPSLRRLLGVPASRGLAVRMAGEWGVVALKEEIRAAAAETSLRRAALEALARMGDPLTGFEGPEAVAALAAVDPAKAAKLAAPVFSGDADPSDVVAAFLSKSGGAEALLWALKDAAIGKDAARLALRAMGSLGRDDRALWELFQKAAGLDGKPIAHSAELVKELAAEARSDGDPVRGERIFRGAVTNCVSCHAIGGAGGRTGPELGEVGTALPPDMLVEALLWPQRAVKENFTASLLQLDDDRIVQGYRVREDKDSLYVRDPASERIDRYPRSKVKRTKDVGSLMPEGVVQGLTRAELRDLLRFLMELGRPGPWQVVASPRVRHWEILVRPGPEPVWAYRPARVAGDLPIEELPHGRARVFAEPSQRLKLPDGLEPRRVDVGGRTAVELVLPSGYAGPLFAELRAD